MNPLLIAISVTLDSVLLGKQRTFSLVQLMLSACFVHVFAFGIGLILGEQLVLFIGHVDHWVALAVFSFLGLSCMKAVLFDETRLEQLADSWPKLALLMVGLSIDAAAVGATSQGLLMRPFTTLIVIGLLAPIFVYIGRRITGALTHTRERVLKLIEGCLFWSIGASIVVTHTQGGF